MKLNGTIGANVRVSLPTTDVKQEKITEFQDLHLVTKYVTKRQGNKPPLILYRDGMAVKLNYIASEVAWVSQDADHSWNQGRRGTNLRKTGLRTTIITAYLHKNAT